MGPLFPMATGVVGPLRPRLNLPITVQANLSSFEAHTCGEVARKNCPLTKTCDVKHFRRRLCCGVRVTILGATSALHGQSPDISPLLRKTLRIAQQKMLPGLKVLSRAILDA